MAVELLQGHLLPKEDLHPQAQGCHGGVELGPGEVPQSQRGLRLSGEEGLPLLQADHRLPGVAVEAHQAPAVRVALQRLVVHQVVQLPLGELGPGSLEQLGEELYPGVQVGSAGVAVDHGHRQPRRGGHQVDLPVHLGQGLFQHHHGEDGSARRHVPRPGGDAVSGGHACARVPFRGAEGHPGAEGPGGVQEPCPLFRQLARGLSRQQDLGQHLLQLPGEALPLQQAVELGEHFRAEPPRLLHGEHAGGLPHPQHLLPGELPVDVPRQGGQVGDVLHVGLPLLHGVVQVGHAPPGGDVVLEQLRQLRRGPFGKGVPPGAEAAELPALPVKGQVAVHHGGDPHGPRARQGDAVPALYLFPKLGHGSLYPGPHVLQVIGPHPVFQLVFPVVGPRGQGAVVRPDEHRLDPGGAQLDAQGGALRLQGRLCLCQIHGHHVPLPKVLFLIIPQGRPDCKTAPPRKKPPGPLREPPESAIMNVREIKRGY